MIEPARDLPPIGHVGYIVENADAGMEAFRRTLGIADFHVYDFVPLRAWADGRVLTPCALRIAVGVMKDGMKIELIQPVAGATLHARFLEEKGPGLHHIGFHTREFDGWRNYFHGTAAGIPFEAEAEDEIHGYRRCCYARFPGMAGIVEVTEIAYKRTGETKR